MVEEEEAEAEAPKRLRAGEHKCLTLMVFYLPKTPYVQMDVVRGGRGLSMGLYMVR